MNTPTHNQMRADLADKKAFHLAQAAAFDYIDHVAEQRVYPNPAAIAQLAVFDEALPEDTSTAEQIITLLARYGSPATVAQTGGRYFGFVNGNAVPAALAAKWLADVWDQNAVLHVASPIAAKLEAVCERWVVDLLGLPSQTALGLVGGTSVATMVGLAAGRYALLQQMGWDVNEHGLFGAPPLRVIISAAAHGTVFKALAILGLGRSRVELIPADAQGRITAADMPALDASCLVILQAGNVNTGSFDDIDAICDAAKAAGAWVHIDGAFGLWAAACERTRHLTTGLEKADSWSVDGHKTLNTPYDCGLVLCKHPAAIVAAMHQAGAYIQTSDERDNMFFTPDMSRRARGVDLWATLKFFGRTGIGDLITGLCERAQQMAAGLRAHHFTVLNDVVFNQVLVRADTAEKTAALLTAIQNSGDIWCGGSTWQGQPAIRISVCSWATTAADIDRAIAAFVAARG